MNPVDHVIYRLRNAHVMHYPFPHFHVNEVFPWHFYDDLTQHLPKDDEYKALAGKYQHRVGHPVIDLVKDFDTPQFAAHVMAVFGRVFFDRYPYKPYPKFRHEIRFIRDEEGYSIGPHTDARNKVVSLLFYLPMEYGQSHLGTSIYVPNDGRQTCPGGPHYAFEGFTEVARMPYVPNSCFGFWKTDNSWHGVEPICEKIQRDVMLFNIYDDSGVDRLVQS